MEHAGEDLHWRILWNSPQAANLVWH